MSDAKTVPLVASEEKDDKDPDLKERDTLVTVGDTVLGVLTVGLWTLGGLYTVNPRETRLILHLGKLTHMESEPGLHWAPQFGREDRLISTADISYQVPEQKVVDTEGVPIMVSAVLVYRIRDAKKAVLDIENVHRYVQSQAAAALKLTVSKYNYEQLKVESSQVQQQVVDLLQDKCTIAGAEVISVTLAELNYAPEIAAAMLKKQQAAALVSARELVVEGAVNICMDAVKKLEASGMTLEQGDKVRIVTNLLTVVSGEQSAMPTISVANSNQ